MRPHQLRSLIALTALAACDDSAGPMRPDGEGLRTDVAVVAATLSSPSLVSFGSLGAEMGSALGGGIGVSFDGGSDQPSVLPAGSLGKTFVYDTLLGNFAISARAGAPSNGVRFVLYQIDQASKMVARPLVETGWADLTSSLVRGVTTGRVEAYANPAQPVKVLDYTAALRGPALLPTLALAGWARNASDSLTFSLSTGIDLGNEGFRFDWRTALPLRGIASRLQTTFTLGESFGLVVDGWLRSRSGELGLDGVIELGTGGTLHATVNGGAFATLTLDGFEGFDDPTPVFTRPDGSPLTPRSRALVEGMFASFAGGYALFEGLLGPMEVLIGTTMLR